MNLQSQGGTALALLLCFAAAQAPAAPPDEGDCPAVSAIAAQWLSASSVLGSPSLAAAVCGGGKRQQVASGSRVRTRARWAGIVMGRSCRCGAVISS